MGKRKTLEQFLVETKIIHPELDFSLVNEYVNNTTKGKTYYYKVRSYKLDDSDKKVYSPLSGIKSIRSK